MRCTEAKVLLSPYMDGAISGAQMQTLDQHLRSCPACELEYISLQQTEQLLSRMGRRKAPADLALKLRLAVSREVARSRRPIFEGVKVRLENALNAFMVPATAGLVTAVVIFGLLTLSLAIPGQLQAGNRDVPLMLYTAPQLQQSAFGMALDSINSESVVVEAYVDSNGRVQDYRILSEPSDTQQLLPQLKNMLIFTTFRPATAMGRPTTGRAVLTFSKISVKG